MTYCLYGREINVGQIDFELGEGAYVQEAWFVDNGNELTDEQLDQLNCKYAGELYQDAYVDLQARAYDDYKARRFD